MLDWKYPEENADELFFWGAVAVGFVNDKFYSHR